MRRQRKRAAMLPFIPLPSSAAPGLPTTAGQGPEADGRAQDAHGRHIVRRRHHIHLLPHGHQHGRHAAEHRIGHVVGRSEEHTSELQSPCNLVCRLLLEKKKNTSPISSETVEPPQDPTAPSIAPLLTHPTTSP